MGYFAGKQETGAILLCDDHPGTTCHPSEEGNFKAEDGSQNKIVERLRERGIYSLTPPNWMPAIMYFERAKYNINNGITDIERPR